MKDLEQTTRGAQAVLPASAGAGRPAPAGDRGDAAAAAAGRPSGTQRSTGGTQLPSRDRDPQPAGHTAHDASHAMRALIAALPSAHSGADGGIDFAATPPALLATVADNAELTAAGLGRGLSAVGNLIPYAAPEMGDGTVSSDTIEALGWLITELGDMAAACLVLATQCRRQCSSGRWNGTAATPAAGPPP